MEYTICKAQRSQAEKIASLIMKAMNYDCCQYFAGDNHTLDDFHRTMTRLVERDDSQYSYRNTIVALSPEQEVIGIATSYDGADLHRLRRAFIDAARADFGQDFSNIDDETEAGELYIDSLAVDERYRGKGIATMLLKATIERGRALGIPAVGLLVDKGNPLAERLYSRLGFRFVNDSEWGSHPMKHLQVIHA